VRLLSILLSFVVLFLTVQPACGIVTVSPQTESCCGEGCAGEEGDAGDSKEKGDCKACNPFQSCGCCTGSVVLPQYAFSVASAPIVYASTEWGFVSLQLGDVPAADFWQPPRRA
jgi:hypothetical protein